MTKSGLDKIKYHETINLCLTSSNPEEQINRYVRSVTAQAVQEALHQQLEDIISGLNILHDEAIESDIAGIHGYEYRSGLIEGTKKALFEVMDMISDPELEVGE